MDVMVCEEGEVEWNEDIRIEMKWGGENEMGRRKWNAVRQWVMD